MSQPMTVFYTTAPEAYDGFGTTSQPTPFIDDRGRPFREVEVSAEHRDWQLNRYGSGLHRAYTEDELNDELGYGHYVIKVEEAA